MESSLVTFFPIGLAGFEKADDSVVGGWVSITTVRLEYGMDFNTAKTVSIRYSDSYDYFIIDRRN